MEAARFLDCCVTEASLACALTNTGGEELKVVNVKIILLRSVSTWEGEN